MAPHHFTYQANLLAAGFYAWTLAAPKADQRAGLRGAVVLALAVAVLNNLGRRAPYYFLDPGSIGTAAVVGNVAVLAVGFLGLGYLLSLLGRASVRRGSQRPARVA